MKTISFSKVHKSKGSKRKRKWKQHISYDMRKVIKRKNPLNRYKPMIMNVRNWHVREDNERNESFI